ncbi:RNA-binding protein 6 isoform X2 [Sphaerodactylus townsendi]|uniref:RNA-binding protein 6 isoform X2 n=1 Tax=Sphaerodactylus townsendi TaxID=933632 RepID=UPI002026C544|nr:RNA-binding protein 6 isoform X2 [Sphaerodactylus townsendi]
MWGNPRPANRMGPYHGSQEERFAPGWNRDYSPPLDSLAQERHSGNFSGRESLPYDIQGPPGILNPQFANREEPSFSYGGRDGPHSDFRGGEGHLQDFGGRDYLSSDFQNRDDSHLEFRGRVPLLPDFRGRDMYQGDFQDREGQSMEYSGGEVSSMDYRNRDAYHMNYRDRETHTMPYRGREDAPSDFRGRGPFDLDLRNRDGCHSHFRTREMPEQDYRGREQPYSDFRKRDMPDMDMRGMGTADLDFRNRDASHSNFRNRQKSQADQDFRGRDVPPTLDFTDRETPAADPDGVDYQQSQPTIPVTDREGKIEEAVHVIRKRSSLAPKEKFSHSEPRTGGEVSQEQNLKTESSQELQSSCGPLPVLQDQDNPPQAFASNQELSTDEQKTPETSVLVPKEKGDLDFLGRQDTDYRGIEYRDVDHRLPGSQLFDYEHGKAFAEGKSGKDSQPDLQDQDYRLSAKDIKPSKLIRLGGVPETATKDDILGAFQACDGTPVKNLRLKDYTTGYDYGYICVEFSLLEEAIACMEANQGKLVIGGKPVTLEYTPSLQFWRCKRCKVSTIGYRSSCYYCRLPRDVVEDKPGKKEQELPEEPVPEEEPTEDAVPPQEPPSSAPKPGPEQQCQSQEPELRKKDESREQWLPQERKKDPEKSPFRKESQEHASRREAVEAKHQKDESKTIMLKRIPRYTPPEVIVGLLAPYVRLSTSSVRVMKNKAGRRGYTYGFIELDSHSEAVRLVEVLQDLDPPISIDGRAVDVNLATGKRRNEYGDQWDVPRYNQGRRGIRDRRGAESQKQRSDSSSDMSTFIYDPDTGNYFDPISGIYYDPNTQREIPMNREASSPSPPPSGRRHKSQERTNERDETFSRDNRDRRERHRNKSAKSESQEEKLPAEDVFKKPLLPPMKKEESAPPQNLEIHRKIKQSEQELAYLERRERERRFKEKGSDRREKLEERDTPERKRPKHFKDSESNYKPTDKGRKDSNNKGSRIMQAMGWKEGSGLGRNEQGMTSPVEAESRKKGAGLGSQGRPNRRQSNETYRDAVRRVMFARYKDLE